MATPTRSAARAGVLTTLPFVVGYAPFALVIGAAGADQGSPWQGWAGSWLVYGGSAHLATLQAVHSGVLVAVATGLLVNARLVVYSASLAHRWRDQPVWFRVLAAAMIVDPTWAIAERHAAEERSRPARRAYFLAAGLTLGAGWSGVMAIGAVAGSRTGGLDLDVVVPICLAALLGPALRDPVDRAAALVGAATMVVARGLPAGTGLVLAIAAGTVAGAVGSSLRTTGPAGPSGSDAASGSDSTSGSAPGRDREPERGDEEERIAHEAATKEVVTT
jgi:predicted branched-subunit amino acid permease